MLQRILPLTRRASASFTPLVRPYLVSKQARSFTNFHNINNSSKYLHERLHIELNAEASEDLERKIKDLTELCEQPSEEEIDEKSALMLKHKKAQLADLAKVKLERQRIFYLQQMHNALYVNTVSGVFKAAAEMKQAGVKPDLLIMNYVISAFAYTRKTDMAFIMFDQMLEMEIQPNSKTLQCLLKACDVTSEWQRAQDVVAKMRDIGVWPEVASHMHLISIYAKCMQFDLAWAEYETLKALFNAIPTDMIHSLLRFALLHKNYEWTHKIIEEIFSHNIYVEPDVIGSVLEAFLAAKNLPGCMRIYDIVAGMLDEGTLIKILNLAGHNRDTRAIAAIFHTIRIITQDSPSRMAYYTLLVSCVHSRKPIEFLDATNTLAAAGHKIGSAFCTQFARICNTPEQLDAARDHLEGLRKNGVVVSVDALDCVLRACARAGELQRSLDLFQECLQTYQLVPDAEAFNSIIEACANANNLDGATSVIQQMMANDVRPTAETYNHLINACVAASNIERAIMALSDMQQSNIQPTYQIYANLAQLCASVEEYEQAQAILKEMVANGMIPDDYLIAITTPPEQNAQQRS